METNVTQVQQFLTDISATRALDGLDDGFKDAEAHYNSFISDLEKFEQLFVAKGDPRGVKNSQMIMGNFNAFYSYGVKMAHAYIEGGPAFGNKLMLDFDKTSLVLQGSMNPFVKAQLKEMDFAIETAESNAGKARIVGLLLGLLVIVVSVLVARATVLDLTLYITKRKQAEDALRYSEQRFRDVSDAAGEYLWEIDANMVYTYVSNRSVEVKGYNPEELLGHTLMEFMPEEEIVQVAEIINRAIAYKVPFKLQHRDVTKSGTVLWEEVNGVPFYDESGGVVGLRGAGLNITERKQAEVEINNLAFYDPLTKLPNRRLLMDRIKQALASSARNGRKGALLFIDLDNFKSLNDTLGHDFGDLLLQQVAQRLESCVREGDTVARLGGDEYVVMLKDLSEHDIESAAQAETVGEKILTTLNQPYRLVAHEHYSTPSIGVSLFGKYEQNQEELLKQADIAMYQAKKAGRNTLRFFDLLMQDTINVRVALESDLRRAVAEQKQFQLYYQVQVASTGRAVGAESLLRWQHPKRGMVPPDKFIPLAEETGLILPLGHWIMATACQQLATWAAQPETAHLTLSVNVSAKQFHLANFVEEVLSLVDHFKIDATKLKLEITESMLLENVNDIITKMTALKVRGINFSMDDFGTGYSSLQYLKKLPLTQLKIDQSFVHEITTDDSDKAIVSTIIAMAQYMNMNVIAEGVETEEQRQLLLHKGCTSYQGYLFGKPMPIEQFNVLLKHA
ncbi:MAG: EAL domain-containing protein [Gallionellaceae bacterium]